METKPPTIQELADENLARKRKIGSIDSIKDSILPRIEEQLHEPLHDSSPAAPMPTAKELKPPPWMRRSYDNEYMLMDKVLSMAEPRALLRASKREAQNSRNNFYFARAKHRAMYSKHPGHAAQYDVLVFLVTYTLKGWALIIKEDFGPEDIGLEDL